MEKIKFSIKTKIILSSLGLLILSISIVTIINIFNINQYGKEEFQVLRTQIYDLKKEKLKNLVEVAYNTLDEHYNSVYDINILKNNASKILKPVIEASYEVIQDNYDKYKNNQLTLIQAQKNAIDVIENIRYNNGNYIWINDTSPKMIIHPDYNINDYPDWYQKGGLTDYKDSNGKRLFVEAVKNAKKIMMDLLNISGLNLMLKITNLYLSFLM